MRPPGKPQRVDEERSDAAAGIKLQRASVRGGKSAARRTALDLHHPQRGRITMAELVGQMAALDQEGRTASHVLAVLLEADFGSSGTVIR